MKTNKTKEYIYQKTYNCDLRKHVLKQVPKANSISVLLLPPLVLPKDGCHSLHHIIPPTKPNKFSYPPTHCKLQLFLE